MPYVKLIDLVRKFDSGVIELPLMQRDYVWPARKVVDLLDSLYRKWPIGVFYIWKTPNNMMTRAAAINRKVGAPIANTFWGYLLDGQQRLTSLSRALDDKIGDNLATRAYFDIRKQIFVMGVNSKTIEKRISNYDPTLIELSRLIPKNITPAIEIQKSVNEIINNLIEKGVVNSNDDIVEYRFRMSRVVQMLEEQSPCEEFETSDSDTDLGNAIELFKRLNKGGKPLSSSDTEAATLTHKATANIVPKMRAFVQLDSQRRLGLNFGFATRALITVHRDNPTFKDLPVKWATVGKDINQSWKFTEDGLAKTINFVTNTLGWTTRRWLPSANALIPLVYLLRDRRDFTKVELEEVRRYLCITALRGVFRGSVETAISTYTNPIRNATSAGQRKASLILKRLTKNQRRRIEADDILNEHGMYSPLMQVYLAYLVSKDVATWYEEAPLLNVARRDINNPLSVHHIFPRELMMRHNVKSDLINSMANYAILSQADNATIGDKDPKTVYDALSPIGKDCADQQLFHILAEDRDWISAYDVFRKKRAQSLADRLNTFLKLAN